MTFWSSGKILILTDAPSLRLLKNIKFEKKLKFVSKLTGFAFIALFSY